MKLIIALAFLLLAEPSRAKLARTPPMGWMSWEIFRCDVDCAEDPNSCINDKLYETTVDSLVNEGFLAAGYDTIHIDDCWMRRQPPRDPLTGRLVAEPTRFPNGMKAVGDYTHSKGVKFGLYTAESPTTCAGYPASANHEALDAETFASWGVDYLKVDGCGDQAYYELGYPAMGKALTNQSRDIVFSCSWPAYLGSNESTKPFQIFIDINCNLWRNWDDIQCHWASLASIIDHWGDYGPLLKRYAAPGHWNDPDMLLIGNDCISDDEARTQMAIWSIIAAPLIMGNDARNVSASAKEILLNKHAIAVDQDPMGEQGLRISEKGSTEIWARNLSDGAVAVGLLNKASVPPLNETCPDWKVSGGGYMEACGGGSGDETCVKGQPLDTLLQMCCEDSKCVGVSYNEQEGTSCLKSNADCGWVSNPSYMYFSKTDPTPPKPGSKNMTIRFQDVGLSGSVEVFDIWAQKSVGTFETSYSMLVPYHGTGFLRLTQV